MNRIFLKFAFISILVAATVACSDKKEVVIPVVTDVTPTEVAVGDEITITGTDLDKVDRVIFARNANELMLQVTRTGFVYISKTSIKVIIPEGVTFPSKVGIAAGNITDQWTDFILTSKASQAQTDALAFLVCANIAYTQYPDEGAEYQQAAGACLQNNLYGKDLSFDSEGKPNNDYTTALFAAIAETVNSMYQGQTDEAKAASIAGIHYMIYAFYQSLQK